MKGEHHVYNKMACGPEPMLPIVRLKGLGNERIAEIALIDVAIKLIDIAEELGGRPISEEPNEPPMDKVEVQITIMFPTEEKLNSFLQSMQSMNGGII